MQGLIFIQVVSGCMTSLDTSQGLFPSFKSNDYLDYIVPDVIVDQSITLTFSYVDQFQVILDQNLIKTVTEQMDVIVELSQNQSLIEIKCQKVGYRIRVFKSVDFQSQADVAVEGNICQQNNCGITDSNTIQIQTQKVSYSIFALSTRNLNWININQATDQAIKLLSNFIILKNDLEEIKIVKVYSNPDQGRLSGISLIAGSSNLYLDQRFAPDIMQYQVQPKLDSATSNVVSIIPTTFNSQSTIKITNFNNLKSYTLISGESIDIQIIGKTQFFMQIDNQAYKYWFQFDVKSTIAYLQNIQLYRVNKDLELTNLQTVNEISQAFQQFSELALSPVFDMTSQSYQISAFDYSEELYIGLLFNPYSENSIVYYQTQASSNQLYLQSSKKYKVTPGQNTITVKVLAEDTQIQYTYLIQIEMLQDQTKLLDIILSSELIPQFQPEISNYITNINYNANKTYFILESQPGSIITVIQNNQEIIKGDQGYETNTSQIESYVEITVANDSLSNLKKYKINFIKIDECGNGVRFSQQEQCDDGNLINGDGCDYQCIIESNYQCSGGSANNRDYCRTNKCGNGIIEEDEQCDDGNQLDNDGCNQNCFIEFCGNGIIEGDEQCDDGNFQNGDGCNFICQIEGCGNGVLEQNEECDDGNLNNNDGCNQDCIIESCGNGIIEENEECDDGNNTDNDGCDKDCIIEYQPECGNGIIDENEECDDGNKETSDGCDEFCKEETICGNGIQEEEEECDDGNQINGDGCENNCKKTQQICGNGKREEDEQCDDGNYQIQDGCDLDCFVEYGWICNVRQGKDECSKIGQKREQNDEETEWNVLGGIWFIWLIIIGIALIVLHILGQQMFTNGKLSLQNSFITLFMMTQLIYYLTEVTDNQLKQLLNSFGGASLQFPRPIDQGRGLKEILNLTDFDNTSFTFNVQYWLWISLIIIGIQFIPKRYFPINFKRLITISYFYLTILPVIFYSQKRNFSIKIDADLLEILDCLFGNILFAMYISTLILTIIWLYTKRNDQEGKRFFLLTYGLKLCQDKAPAKEASSIDKTQLKNNESLFNKKLQDIELPRLDNRFNLRPIPIQYPDFSSYDQQKYPNSEKNKSSLYYEKMYDVKPQRSESPVRHQSPSSIEQHYKISSPDRQGPYQGQPLDQQSVQGSPFKPHQYNVQPFEIDEKDQETSESSIASKYRIFIYYYPTQAAVFGLCSFLILLPMPIELLLTLLSLSMFFLLSVILLIRPLKHSIHTILHYTIYIFFIFLFVLIGCLPDLIEVFGTFFIILILLCIGTTIFEAHLIIKQLVNKMEDKRDNSTTQRDVTMVH